MSPYRRRLRAPPDVQQKGTRTPDFESGILAEPLITFGRQHQHVDPKTGLALYGPYSLKDQLAPALKGFIVGIVGPRNMVADAEQWLAACSNTITNDGSQPFQSPHFPGMRDGPPFSCTLTYGEAWREVVRDTALGDALGANDLARRITKVVQLYLDAIETLSTREPKSHLLPVIAHIFSKGMPNRLVLYVQSRSKTSGFCFQSSRAFGWIKASRSNGPVLGKCRGWNSVV